MNPEEIRRRLANLDPDLVLGIPEPTAEEIKEHFKAMRAEHRTPAREAFVYARLDLLHQQAEIGLYNYRRFMAGGRNWSIDDG